MSCSGLILLLIAFVLLLLLAGRQEQQRRAEAAFAARDVQAQTLGVSERTGRCRALIEADAEGLLSAIDFEELRPSLYRYRATATLPGGDTVAREGFCGIVGNGARLAGG